MIIGSEAKHRARMSLDLGEVRVKKRATMALIEDFFSGTVRSVSCND